MRDGTALGEGTGQHDAAHLGSGMAAGVVHGDVARSLRLPLPAVQQGEGGLDDRPRLLHLGERGPNGVGAASGHAVC